MDEKSYPALYEAIQEVNQKMGVQLRVYITPDKGVEAAINPLTKSVFITEALSRLPTHQIKAVLAHEAHHAKQPPIKHVVSTLATAISIPVAVAAFSGELPKVLLIGTIPIATLSVLERRDEEVQADRAAAEFWKDGMQAFHLSRAQESQTTIANFVQREILHPNFEQRLKDKGDLTIWQMITQSNRVIQQKSINDLCCWKKVG